jgi:hypothetical protein
LSRRFFSTAGNTPHLTFVERRKFLSLTVK